MQRAPARRLVLVCAALLARGVRRRAASKKSASSTTRRRRSPARRRAVVDDRRRRSSTTVHTAPVVTDVFPTISLPCQPVPIPSTPVTSPAPVGAVFLTKVRRAGRHAASTTSCSASRSKAREPARLHDHLRHAAVHAGRVGRAGRRHGQRVHRREDEARLRLRLRDRPARPTPDRSASRPPRANHVTEIVETGDFEGVLTWVIGLDAKRPFTVEATGTPQHASSSVDGRRCTASGVSGSRG